ncbi:MAG: helix-turn-helix domain-containing protein, partial [Lachnospiraceae bacterium]|nr:helix-turn-helix domain-containing protein [Lachnospiraceae bacterium]
MANSDLEKESLNEALSSTSDPQSSFVDQTYQVLNNRHNVIYQFVMRYNDYIYAEHDYGNGDPLTMIEVHTLTYIEDHPGTTVTELTNYWHKTKGAIS